MSTNTAERQVTVTFNGASVTFGEDTATSNFVSSFEGDIHASDLFILEHSNDDAEKAPFIVSLLSSFGVLQNETLDISDFSTRNEVVRPLYTALLEYAAAHSVTWEDLAGVDGEVMKKYRQIASDEHDSTEACIVSVMAESELVDPDEIDAMLIKYNI